jgi:hypothetical protein
MDPRGFDVDEARTEFDGYYSFIGVPAGKYEIRVLADDGEEPKVTRRITLDGEAGFVTLDEIYL